MSESLRDRVARVLAESNCTVWDLDTADGNDVYLRYADALIAAGLVTEPKTEPYVTCTMCGSTSGFHVGQCKARGRL